MTRTKEYYKYDKFNNDGKKCDRCDYVGEHYCTGRPFQVSFCIDVNYSPFNKHYGALIKKGNRVVFKVSEDMYDAIYQALKEYKND